VAFDGYYLIFVRFREGGWHVEPALAGTPPAAGRLLRSVVSLSSGRALIPENLVEDFGAQNLYSQRVTRALYHSLDGHEDDLVGALFQQWKLFFSEVSGYEEATARLRDKKELRQFARGMGLRPEKTDPPRLFFSIHTYFSFLAKAIARLVLERYAGGGLGTTPLTVLANLDGEPLRRELERLEEGGIFRTLGFVNLLEGDFFSWYLHAWSDEVKDALQLALRRLAEYNPATIEENPYAARDLLKKLYHYLMPRELRHDLGEYYTPDWLATRVLRQLGEPLFMVPDEGRPAKVDFGKRLLDPACGSGTFLILAIRAIKEHARRQGFAEADTLDIILNNVVGIDLNPLAVLAARVGYLLAIADLVPYRRQPIVIPIYLADSILTPTAGATLFEQGQRSLETVVGRFPVPQTVDSADDIGKLADVLYEYVQSDFSTDAFLERMRKELGVPEGSRDETTLRELYEHTLRLRQQRKDGIWARIVKNYFMPLFIGQFDCVAGNPPWVNWESLPDGYRQKTAPLWQHYELFPHKGFDAILGKSKDDISIVMTYAALERFLKIGERALQWARDRLSTGS
jgi:SAM-dependent methyltransferase